MKKVLKIIGIVLLTLFVAMIVFIKIILYRLDRVEKIQRDAEERSQEIDWLYEKNGYLPSRDQIHPGGNYEGESLNMLWDHGHKFYYYIINDSVYSLEFIDKDNITHKWRSDEREWK